MDIRFGEQVNLILHHPEFRALEGTWRGLAHLVNRTQTDEGIKIKVLDLSKGELSRMMSTYAGACWHRNPLFRMVNGDLYTPGGGPGRDPFGCLIGDYEFDHGPDDVRCLSKMAGTAAAALCPFITAPSPRLLGISSWRELDQLDSIASMFQTPEHADWRALRASEDSRFVGLAMPRFLARAPYGRQNPVGEFTFDEDVAAEDGSKYVWCNAAYAMAANLIRAFERDGLCVRISGIESGEVEDLPYHITRREGAGEEMIGPTEVAFPISRERELADGGLMPLSHVSDSDRAVFIGVRSLQNPKVYMEASVTAMAALSARLPHLFAACRFGQYMKCIARDWVGCFPDRDQLERLLNNWIVDWVHPNPRLATDEEKARKPLSEARVKVEEALADPGRYVVELHVGTCFGLDAFPGTVQLVFSVPG